MGKISRFLNRWRQTTLAAEFDEEVQSHLDRRTERNIREGMSPEAAGAEARRWFGSLTRAREGVREARIATWIDDLGRDLSHGARVFRRQPLLTAIAVVGLSLGIGANAGVFSLLNAAVLRPIPFPEADRLVWLSEGFRPDAGRGSPTIPEVLDIRALTSTLDGVSFFDTRDAQIAGGSEPARVFAARVEPSLLPLFGARPAIGRLFSESDSTGSPAVILSDGLFRRNFGADPAVIGRTLDVNSAPHLIVGVLPPGFSMDFLASAAERIEIYLPYPLNPTYTSRTAEFANTRRVLGIGRIKAGVPLAAVLADLSSIGAKLSAEHPGLYTRSGFFFDGEPLREAVTAGNRAPLLILFGAVGVVLLIACVNVAQFLLAHAIEREPEVALRSALGASRLRLVRQFLSETLALALVAGVLGVLQAYWVIGVLRALMGTQMLVLGPITLDLTVLIFAAGVAVLTAALSGLVPAMRFSRTHLRPSLEARGTTGGRPGRSRQLFVAVQVALSVVLLVQAGLLLRSLQVLQRSQSGFSSESVTVMRIRGMGAGPALGETYRRFLDSIATIPGLSAAAITSTPVPGRYQMVSPQFFSVLQIPIVRGRTFSDADTASTTPVAMVNEEMARQTWPGEEAIGRTVRVGDGPRAATVTVIGIVGNARRMFQNGDVPQVYVSYLQQAEPNMSIVVRPVPGAVVPTEAVKSAVWSVEPRQALFNIRTLDEILSDSVNSQRVAATLIGGLAALAFVMSIAGIFTVVSYLTSRRIKEVALRRAIGAESTDIMWLLAGQTLLWALGGLVVGGAGAVFASTSLRAVVNGLVPLDVPIVAVVGGTYLGVVAIAMALPALRALRVDPATALRAD